jgi:cell division protein FtsB
MREFKKRRTTGAAILRISAGAAGVLLLAGVATVASRAAWDMYGKFAEAAAARASTETQLQELQDRHQKIEADVQALSSERGLEAQVRERYGVAKPGEGQITIVRLASSTEVLRQEPGLLDKLWHLLFVW